MFEEFKKYHRIIVLGPSRSGTRIATKMIAQDTGFTYIDEHEITKIRRAQKMLFFGEKVVIQAPNWTPYARMLTNKHTLIVFMKRDVKDIIRSQKRIGWGIEGSKHTRRVGNAEDIIRKLYFRDKGKISEIIYEIWDKYQKDTIKNYYELEYESLKGHPLWIDKEKRKHFKKAQTKSK